MKPPYRAIADLLLKGQVVPFLGAAVNFGSRADGVKFDPGNPTVLPGGQELSLYLSEFSGFQGESYEMKDLPRVSAFSSEAVGRERLRMTLHEIFDHPHAPAPIHQLLARVARQTHMLIVTTNYDDLMEQALTEEGVPYDVVYYPTDRTDMAAAVFCWEHGAREPDLLAPNKLPIDLSCRTVVYKMHGTVVTERRMPDTPLKRRMEWDSYVITEDDYVEFLARMADQKAIPQKVISHFRGRHFLFMGYGLGDWNLRVLMRSLNGTFVRGEETLPGDARAPISSDGQAVLLAERQPAERQGMRSWAIQFKPSEEAEFLWRSRMVNIYDVDIKTFNGELAGVMRFEVAPAPAVAPALGQGTGP